MRESVTYQMIINEGIERGRAEGARQVLLGLGARKLGPADSRTLDLLQRIADVDTLELMAEAVLTSTTWDEVLEAASR